MKRILIAALVCFSLPALAFYGSRDSNYNVAISGSAAPTFSAGASVAPLNNSFSSGTKTISGLNGGSNFPSGALVIVGVGQDQSGINLGTVLIGGQSPTLVSGTQNTGHQCQIYQVVMPASEPDTISFSNGTGINTIGAVAAYLTNVNSTVVGANKETWAAQVDPQAMAASIAIPTSGFGFIFAYKYNSANANPTALTWTSTTNSSGDNFAGTVISTGGATIGSAHSATATASWTPGASGVTHNMNFSACVSGASWGP